MKKLNKMKNIKYILGLITVLATTFACVEDAILEDTSGPVVSAAVKINEVMSTGSPDWIELYNGGTQAINLSGYTLSDTSQDWVIDNLTIAAGDYVSFDCDDSNVANVSTNFKISSGGEKITMRNASNEVIDEITTPDMASQVGLTYGREIDGGDVWVVMSPTKAKANSNVNEAPVITAEPLTELTRVYAVTASDAGGLASVKLIHMLNDGVQSIDMALVDGEYKTSVPVVKVGDVVKYYVVATDNTGLVTYYPEEGNNTPNEFTVAGGIENLDIVGEQAGYRGAVTFKATPYYMDQVDEIRLYYLLPGQMQDETNDDKTKVILAKNGDVYEGIVPAQNTDDVVSYYLRVEYIDGTKTYEPLEVEGGDFNHDLGTTWPSYTVEAITYDDVVNTTVNATEGPLTSLVFPTNPIPGTDINLVLAYTSTVEIKEARVYFAVGDTPVYVKANKISGEDDASFTQTGVTINLKDAMTATDLSLSESGAKVSFYVRIATDTAEYYYSNDGAMSLDDTPGGGTTDESDAFKADPSLWNVYNVQ